MDLLQWLFGQGNNSTGRWPASDFGGAGRLDTSGLGAGWAVTDPTRPARPQTSIPGPGWPVTDTTTPANNGLNWEALPGVIANLGSLAAALGPQSPGGPPPVIPSSPVYKSRATQPIQLLTRPEPVRRTRVPGLLGEAFSARGGLLDD